MPIRLSEDEFGELVDEALAGLPEQFVQYMENLSVEVQPRPTRELMKSMHIRGGGNLLGVYHGVPLTQKNVDAPIDWPERIVIFQRNIESICDNHQQVIEQIRTTVLHEVGHHFGMDEDDLEKLGYG
ncbi:MAG: metallopeptidase family protein [Planctomycetaceae bacterium]|nr:MAG: metallopeptidase family protein [Planctomycetaceae bacterium]